MMEQRSDRTRDNITFQTEADQKPGIFPWAKTTTDEAGTSIARSWYCGKIKHCQELKSSKNLNNSGLLSFSQMWAYSQSATTVACKSCPNQLESALLQAKESKFEIVCCAQARQTHLCVQKKKSIMGLTELTGGVEIDGILRRVNRAMTVRR